MFFLGFGACAAPQPQVGADFYEGLKQRQNGAAPEAEALAPGIAYFEKALKSPNTYVAAAAVAELMDMHYAGTALSAETMRLIRQRAVGPWAAVFELMDSGFDREKALALLLNASIGGVGPNRLPNAAALYLLREWRRRSVDAPSDAENAAIEGRFAVTAYRYREALDFFRVTITKAPELFFRFPDLLADLGRSFQYTATGSEGMDLFLEWEQNRELFLPDNEKPVRYRLLFFAARIARQRGLPDIALFERALAFVPETPAGLPVIEQAEALQSDACIWYILDSGLAHGPDGIMPYLERYIPQWQDDSYFSDVMDKLARELILKRQWDKALSVLGLLLKRNGPPTAQYAWIIARAIEEGLLPPEEMEKAAALLNLAVEKAGLVKALAGIAYNTSAGALYYRSLSAAVLGEPFLDTARPPANPAGPLPEALPELKSQPEIMQFLLGFFEHDAARFAPRFIRAMEDQLAPAELYRLAGALGTAGQYRESIRLVSLYTRRNSYRTERRDLELLYPRPFREIIERYAAEADIEPALLYGLIRTESAFDSDIVSRSGAVGLTQLMPATAEEMAARIRRRGGPDYANAEADYLRNPEANVHIGSVYFAYLVERMEDPLLALLAYNGGMGRVRRWRSASAHLPTDIFLETVEYAETRNYGRSVMAAAAMYRELYP